MNLEKEIFELAVKFLNERYQNDDGCVAILRLEDGIFLKSVYTGDHNLSSVDLCAETGAICEAHKLNKKVTHSICIYREKESDRYEILSPCGVCQERLRFWGEDVKVAITNPKNKIVFKTLKEISPYYWLAKK